MEYIITENAGKLGWCLFKLAGTDKEGAERALARLQAEYPDKELRIETVEAKDCWWNDPFLCN